MTPWFTIVVAARDEEDRLAGTLEALWSLPGLARILLADDGSLDSTASLAHSLGAEVIAAAPPGRPSGKGATLLAGLRSVRRTGAGVLLLADADLGPSASELAHLLAALDADHPAAIAAFPPARGGGFGLVKSLSVRAISRRTGYSPTEPLSGQRALLPAALEALPGIAPGFGAEVGMTLDLLASGIEPVEIPLPLGHRPTGKSPAGFAHRALQGRDILRAFHGERLPW